VFNSNGGLDTVLGDVRTQDVFNGITNDQRVETASSDSSFGAFDGLDAMISGSIRRAMHDLRVEHAERLHSGNAMRGYLDKLGEEDLGAINMDQFDLNTMPQAFGRTMYENDDDTFPLDFMDHASVTSPPEPVTDMPWHRMFNPMASEVDFLSF
jgi:hypothetical protein